MNPNLYVGNLSFDCTEEKLQNLFARSGTVQKVIIVKDKTSGKSKGFGFVTMNSPQEAQSALEAFHETDQFGRKIIVREAYDKNDTRQSSSFKRE